MTMTLVLIFSFQSFLTRCSRWYSKLQTSFSLRWLSSCWGPLRYRKQYLQLTGFTILFLREDEVRFFINKRFLWIGVVELSKVDVEPVLIPSKLEDDSKVEIPFGTFNSQSCFFTFLKFMGKIANISLYHFQNILILLIFRILVFLLVYIEKGSLSGSRC